MSDDPKLEALIAEYEEVCSEITRYRDREWNNVTLFLAAQAAIVAIIITNGAETKNYKWAFDVALTGLAVGNIFYSQYAHDRLVLKRNRRKELRVSLKLPAETEESDRGFWSHQFPFYMAAVMVAIFGICVLHK